MSKRHCLDNPDKPPKAFRDALVKRKKTERDKLKSLLNPCLAAAFEKYKAIGTSAKKIPESTLNALREQLGEQLVAALDGDLDFQRIQCKSCEFKQRELERQQKALEKDMVRVACLPPTPWRSCLAAACYL